MTLSVCQPIRDCLWSTVSRNCTIYSSIVNYFKRSLRKEMFFGQLPILSIHGRPLVHATYRSIFFPWILSFFILFFLHSPPQIVFAECAIYVENLRARWARNLFPRNWRNWWIAFVTNIWYISIIPYSPRSLIREYKDPYWIMQPHLCKSTAINFCSQFFDACFHL